MGVHNTLHVLSGTIRDLHVVLVQDLVQFSSTGEVL